MDNPLKILQQKSEMVYTVHHSRIPPAWVPRLTSHRPTVYDTSDAVFFPRPAALPSDRFSSGIAPLQTGAYTNS
jgi:hypothetical protein